MFRKYIQLFIFAFLLSFSTYQASSKALIHEYGNPVLTIANEENQEVKVFILDAKGHKFLEKNLGVIHGELSMEDILEAPLSKGIYIIEIHIKGQRPIKRLVIF